MQSTLSLVDINADRLRSIAAYTQRLIDQQRLPAALEVTVDHRLVDETLEAEQEWLPHLARLRHRQPA